MTDENNWHLTKAFNIGLIVTLLGAIISGSIAWANALNDIERNTENCLQVGSNVSGMGADIKIIREGLIAEGIIKVK